MKTVLPFKSQPKQETRLIGDERCGVLEMPVYKSLLWHERAALRKADGTFNMFKETAMAAGKIAKLEERTDLLHLQQMVITLLTVGMGLPGQLSDEMMRIRVEHAEILNQLQVEVTEWNDRRQLAGVTALIRCRLEGFADWDETLVEANVKEDLMVHLYNFLTSEENKGIEAQDEDRQEVDEEELVGKSSEANTENPPSPTGDGSTGASSSSTPDATSSAGTTSEASPSPESSTPTKEAKSKSAKAST